MAFFSEVSSQWKSTNRRSGSGSPTPSSRVSAITNGESSWFMVTRPMRLMTATGVPSARLAMSQPRPGASSG